LNREKKHWGSTNTSPYSYPLVKTSLQSDPAAKCAKARIGTLGGTINKNIKKVNQKLATRAEQI
jgi:hypothetical protein